MIRSWRNRESKKLFGRAARTKFQPIEKSARIKPGFLNAATNLKELSLRGMRLEKLSGDREWQYSIRINRQFRICFEWRDGDAYNVEVTGYH